MNIEQQRLAECRDGILPWKLWGPYLSERQWGTVREDYSADGDAWAHFSFDQASGRAYRWGEDGIAGMSDDQQRICLGLALWNGRDPILKERLFGLSNAQGNHGEDCKELYYYLDATPTHSYLKTLYKYPQQEFPYQRLYEENVGRGQDQPEFELLDTGVFDDNRYFDIFVEYAKKDPGDILVRIRAYNRGPEPAEIFILPQLWFRNTWSWSNDSDRPSMSLSDDGSVLVRHPEMADDYRWYVDGAAELLFCENETNPAIHGMPQPGYFKDGIQNRVITGETRYVNPGGTGTKCAAHYRFTVAPGDCCTVRARLSTGNNLKPFHDFADCFAERRSEADMFYDELQQGLHDPDRRNVQRQALAGMIWNKQFFHYDVYRWLKGDSNQPAPPEERRAGRNADWQHLYASDIISMPDKWEYPWFAAWDLAFHCVPLAMIDAEFAKHQLVLLTGECFMHPQGQLPAYEWNFSDVNPPVHAGAAWDVFEIDREQRGDSGDIAFLEAVFHKLMLNFTWWVNRKDVDGRNVFQGGFLGLDNISLFDRSKPLPTGGYISQADGTTWMAVYCLFMMRIALELSKHSPAYEDIAVRFFMHFLLIAKAMTNIADESIGLWDPEDEFYYDVLELPDGARMPLKVRSLVGLIPLLAVEIIEPETIKRLPRLQQQIEWFYAHRPDLVELVSRWHVKGRGERGLLSLLRGYRLKCLLRRMLDETEFLSDYGVRSLSRHHREHPVVFEHGGEQFRVDYEPEDSHTRLFGGNSNWRGPIWFPLNYLILRALGRFHDYYTDDFKVECPVGSGRRLTISEVADELSERLVGLFLRGRDGRRAVFGENSKLQEDEHFRDYLQFYEFFHGDTGRGLGASHQTGWTGLVAWMLSPNKPGGMMGTEEVR